jgi:DNA-binding NarL/FixJ family response regulator
VKAAERLQPDVVLMDIRLPGEGGIAAAQQVTRRVPNSKVVILTSFADDELVLRAIRAGAWDMCSNKWAIIIIESTRQRGEALPIRSQLRLSACAREGTQS